MLPEKLYCNNYEVDLKNLQTVLRRAKGRRILLHAPDGLKHLYSCIAEVLGKVDFEVYYSLNPGYGACDLPLEEAKAVEADLILHIGHSEYKLAGTPGVNTIYLPVYYIEKPEVQLLEDLHMRLEHLGANRVSVSSTLIEAYFREHVANYLLSKGYTVKQIEEPVLGCFYNHVVILDHWADSHVVIAGGVFHPLGLALVSSKPVVALDPYLRKTWYVKPEAEKVLKKRMYMLLRAKMSTRGLLGLVIGARPGQYRYNLVEYLEKLAESKGYKVYKITSEYLTLERLIAIDDALNLDFYVVTSCPRLAIDDLSEFHKPVLTPGEFIMLINESARYIFPW
ncbi:MAG: diphthamide biosynthesis enzyme Dph2 [Desulfurococcaceae archaeon]